MLPDRLVVGAPHHQASSLDPVGAASAAIPRLRCSLMLEADRLQLAEPSPHHRRGSRICAAIAHAARNDLA
jgi:hypothetical protein